MHRTLSTLKPASSIFQSATRYYSGKLVRLHAKPTVRGSPASFSNLTRSFSSSPKSNEEDDALKRPTLESLKGTTFSYSQFAHETLIVLSLQGDGAASEELLVRNVMVTDRLEYEEAVKVFSEIEKENKGYKQNYKYPYLASIGGAGVVGALSFPFVFYLPTAKWFNERYVTMDYPQASDLDTWLEVGAWTWNWNEPFMGTISFVLIAAQFMKAQMQNIGIRSATDKFFDERSEHLAKKFPQYSSKIIMQYSRSVRMLD